MKNPLLGALTGALLATACALPRPSSPAPSSGLRPFQSDVEIAAYLRAHVEPPPAPIPPSPAPSCAVVAGDSSRTVAGTVTATADGEPLSGAVVRVEGTTRQAVTDAEGRYRIPGVPAGTHVISVARLGLQPASCRGSVGTAASLRADFRLTASAIAIEGLVVNQLAASSPDGSITNTQHADVDEGGIVKVHGEHLVILRRGRLFTLRIGDAAPRPVAVVDAFGPGIDPDGAWYDEMLISGNRVIVLGYSYDRAATEIGLFDIDAGGRLRYRSTHYLRSNDYYSSRNYASRLVEGRLVFYTPMYLGSARDPMASLPALRRWKKDAAFRPIAPAPRVFRPARPLPDGTPLTLHTVTVCDLDDEDLDCEATVVMAGWGRVFYVSPGAVYVWSHAGGHHSTGAMVYRIPLDGSRPGALGASGMPIDQFSFLEQDGHLAVLLRDSRAGEAMWNAEHARNGSLSLLRVPTSAFGDGSRDAESARYRWLPAPPADGPLTNRFVGSHLLFGVGSGWGAQRTRDSALFVTDAVTGETRRLPIGHNVDRIEVMGRDAVVVGASERDLYFTAVRLGTEPRLAHRYVRPNASQGETRSHGFFYRPDDPSTGVLGLPIRGEGRPGYEHLDHGSASVLYLRNTGRAFWELGDLAARPEPADDRCRASCVDWYGNARPIFLGDRVFALLGYEIVEGRIEEDGIHEVGRVSYAPRGGRRSDD